MMGIVIYTLLFLFVSIIPKCASTIDENVYSCSHGKIWDCNVWQMEESPVPSDSPSVLESEFRPNRRTRRPNIYFSHLNKINPLDGSIYVAARLKVELQQIALQNATGMSIQIIPKDPDLSPLYYQAQLVQRRPIPDGYTIDFTIPIENQLKHEHQYALKFDLLPSNLGISTQKSLSISSYALPEVDCNKEIPQDEKRQYVTSRFTVAFRQLTFYPHHSTVNLSFYAAPRSYCLSYEVLLSLGGSHQVESHIVHASEMQEINGGASMIGTVTLTKIIDDQNYTIRIIPYSATNSCVCFDCSCVLVQSELFNLPQLQASLTSSKLIPNYASSSGDQSLRIRVMDERINSNENNLPFLLITFFCLLSLTFISLALIIMLCRTVKPGSLLLLKSVKISEDREKPLLSSYKSTILILNAETSKARLVEMLAKMLEHDNMQITTIEREQKSIEKNLQMWCNDVLIKADRIILFHTHRAAYLMFNKLGIKSNSPLDTAFQMILSFIRIDDSRFIHACWDNQRVSLFHNVETLYSLPRNIHYIFNGLGLNMPKQEKFKQFQEEYRMKIEPVEDQTLSTQSQILSVCPEDRETFESGYKTTDSSDAELLAKYKDVTSIASSNSDSGLII